MVQAVADTHALHWYLYSDPRLSKAAKAAIDSAHHAGDQIGVSSISLIEIAYLAEKGRVPTTAFDRIVALLNLPNWVFEEIQVEQQVADALRKIDRTQVPELNVCLQRVMQRHIDGNSRFSNTDASFAQSHF